MTQLELRPGINKNAIFANTRNCMINYYSKHLENCIWNPTIGLLKRQKYSIQPQTYILKNDKIKYLEETLKIRINDLYPKTKKIRKFIIKDNRLSLNHVTKAKGYTLLDKLKIFMKIK